jgi:glycosyltransferase involved in cell wall biosynthesis
MRVLFDHRIFLMQRHGGVSRYFVELIRELARLPNIQPIVFAGMHASRLLHSQQHSLGARVIGMCLPLGIRHNRFLSLCNKVMFSRYINSIRPDIYHATYYHKADTKYGCPLVITVHDMIAELFPSSENAKDPTIQRKRLSAQSASKIICVSESTRRDFTGLHPDLAGKATVVHHGSSFAGNARSTPPIPESYLLYVGQRCARKNSDLLKSVMLQLGRPQLKLVFFGGQPPSRAELATAAAMNAIYVPGQSDDDLATWYKHASALLYPSHYEGFGMPPLEAMLMGCPVICSNTSSLPEVVGDAGLLLDPNNCESWPAAIASLLSNDLLRKTLALKGKERARLFTWAACAKKSASVYASALNDTVVD